ncbi:hypothetical protein AB6N23_04840 [Cellulomonas sp. 179-A 9B4 NHS]|uniref:hypothetical protein n=1 Tax=Cellulomonas sp. 179-A 9B4 NHS TaxID=3142379 RepID=UPI0039A081E8
MTTADHGAQLLAAAASAAAAGSPVSFSRDPWDVLDAGRRAGLLGELAAHGLVLDRDAHADGRWHAVPADDPAAPPALAWSTWCARATAAVLGADAAEPRLRSRSVAAELTLDGTSVLEVGVRDDGVWARVDGADVPPAAAAGPAGASDVAASLREVVLRARAQARAVRPAAGGARARGGRPAHPGDLFRVVASPSRNVAAEVTSPCADAAGTCVTGTALLVHPFEVRLDDRGAAGWIRTGHGTVVPLDHVEAPWDVAADRVTEQALAVSRAALPERYLRWLAGRVAMTREEYRRGGGDMRSLSAVLDLVRAEFGVDAVDRPVLQPGYDDWVRVRVYGSLDLTVGFEHPRGNFGRAVHLPTGAGVAGLPGEYAWGGTSVAAVRHQLRTTHEFCRALLDLPPLDDPPPAPAAPANPRRTDEEHA